MPARRAGPCSSPARGSTITPVRSAGFSDSAFSMRVDGRGQVAGVPAACRRAPRRARPPRRGPARPSPTRPDVSRISQSPFIFPSQRAFTSRSPALESRSFSAPEAGSRPRESPMSDTATMHIDGASRGNPGPAAYAVVLARPGLPVVEEADDHRHRDEQRRRVHRARRGAGARGRTRREERSPSSATAS